MENLKTTVAVFDVAQPVRAFINAYKNIVPMAMIGIDEYNYHEHIYSVLKESIVQIISDCYTPDAQAYALNLLCYPEMNKFMYSPVYNNAQMTAEFAKIFRELGMSIYLIMFRNLGFLYNKTYILESITIDYMVISIFEEIDEG